MESLGEFIKSLNTVISYFASIGIILGFLLREHIKHYFNRDINRLQQEHKKALEYHKTKLMVDLEVAKLSIDLKRSLAMEIMNKKLIAYQDTIGHMRFYCGLVQQWNKNPNFENIATIFGGRAGKIAWEQVAAIPRNSFFITAPNVEKKWKETTQLYASIQEQVNLAQKVDDDMLEAFSQNINDLKKELLESLLNENLLELDIKQA